MYRTTLTLVHKCHLMYFWFIEIFERKLVLKTCVPGFCQIKQDGQWKIWRPLDNLESSVQAGRIKPREQRRQCTGYQGSDVCRLEWRGAPEFWRDVKYYGKNTEGWYLVTMGSVHKQRGADRIARRFCTPNKTWQLCYTSQVIKS